MRSPIRACFASNSALSRGASRSDIYLARVTTPQTLPQDTLPNPLQRTLSPWITQLPRHRRVSVDEHHPQRHPGARRHLLVSLHDRDSCKSLYAEEGVLLYQDRVVVPPSLRRRVLQNLHAAHQGTSSMEQRARAIVYWPGISKDIRETREGCADCNRNAPSQAATPPFPSTPPLSPFEAVFADFFDYRGCHYLVVGDRLSGWVEVLSSTAGTNLAGSAGLVRHLRSFFATFGVPE